MKKGFTLIEILAVITILSIIVGIVGVASSGILKKQKEALSDIQLKSISGAVDAYIVDNILDIGDYRVITYGDLVDDNYTDSSKDIENEMNIYICKINNSYVYDIKYEDKCSMPFGEKLFKSGELGLVEDEYESGRYYYRGADPKNKLVLQENVSGTITDIDYRIISFEADGTIKVVREERIDANGIAWDTKPNRPTTSHPYCTNSSSYGCNAWANQSNTYRNGALMNDYFSLKYYASNTATSMSIQGSESGTKTTVTKDSSLNIFLNGTYLTTNLIPISNYIDEHMWDAGGIKYLEGKSFDKDIKETKVNQWKGYIALPSIIDYKNASDNTTQCINLYSGYNVISGTTYYPCTQNSDGTVNNYLYKSDYYQWSLTVSTSSRYHVWSMSSSGGFSSVAASNESNIFVALPSFYLKSTIKLTGEGTTISPYRISDL